MPTILLISPQADGTVQVAGGHSNWNTRFRGESPDYLAIKDWQIAEGAAFGDEDLDHSASKVVLEQTVREQLYGPKSPVGELVRITGQLFEVTGVLAAKGQSADGRDQDDFILLPTLR